MGVDGRRHSQNQWLLVAMACYSTLVARNQTWTWMPPVHLVEQIDAVALKLGQTRSEAMRLIVAQGCVVMSEIADELAAKAAARAKKVLKDG